MSSRQQLESWRLATEESAARIAALTGTVAVADPLTGPEIEIFGQLGFVRDGGVVYVRLLVSDSVTRRRDL